MSFYVSDAFTLTVPSSAPSYVHYPGPFNASKVYGPGEAVIVDVHAGELGFTVFKDSMDGMNVDMQLGFYNVSTGGAVPYGPAIPFRAPYGTASNGQVMHAEARFGQYGYARRFPTRPIGYQGGTSTGVSQTQVGAIFTFNHGSTTNVTVQYQYFLQGELLSSGESISSSTEMLVTMPDHSQWQIPVSAV